MNNFGNNWVLVLALFLGGCATIQEWLPDSYESPDGKYKQTCVKNYPLCTITCDVEIDGHKSKKTFPLKGCTQT